jgi:chromate transport protein ChrA
MNKAIKKTLKRAVLFLILSVFMGSISLIAKSVMEAEITGIKIDAAAMYFNGTTKMGSAEITRNSVNTIYGLVNFFLTLLTVLCIAIFLYNGFLAVYKYLKSKEKIENEKQ